MKMSTLAILFAVLLIVLGLVGGLICKAPALFSACGLGVMLLICGGMARRDEWRMHAMHGAALVGVLGLLNGVTDWAKLPALFAGDTLAKPHEVIGRSLVAVLCLVFLVFCIRSFILARLPRKES